MTSVIFRMASNFFLIITLIFSLWVLVRGHDTPGGGFVGGLIGACGFALYLLAYGAKALRKIIKLNMTILLAIGFLFVLISGLIALFQKGIFLTSVWTKVPLIDLYIGSPILFDAGVYLVVLSSVLIIILSLEEGT